MPKTGNKRRRSPGKTEDFDLKSIRFKFKLDDCYFKWTLKDVVWDYDGWRVTAKELADEVVATLQDLESQKWAEIKSASGGKSEGHGTNNHFIPTVNLPSKEMREFNRLGLKEKYDKVFSLRLNAKCRLVGVVDLNIFRPLWRDPEHHIFPTR